MYVILVMVLTGLMLEAQLVKQVCFNVCDPCYGFNWFNVIGTTS